MPRGNNDTIPSGTGKTYRTTTGDIRETLLVLNPNNGLLYVAINTQASPAVWDFVVPSQSRAYLPGPWLGYGLYYVDQSGAGGSGNVTIYESDIAIQVPDYAAVGIARLAQQTSMDIVEGTAPGNPGAGLLRLWADTAHYLDTLHSDGTIGRVLDSWGIPQGTFAGVGVKQQLHARGGAQAINIACAFNAVTSVSASFSFTKDIAPSLILVHCYMSGYYTAPAANGATVNLSLLLDAGGYERWYFLSSSGPASVSTWFGGGFAALIPANAIAVGAHTLVTQCYVQSPGGVTFNCGGAAGQDFLLDVLEVKL